MMKPFYKSCNLILTFSYFLYKSCKVSSQRTPSVTKIYISLILKAPSEFSRNPFFIDIIVNISFQGKHWRKDYKQEKMKLDI